MSQPLILSLLLDSQSAASLSRLRTLHFPSHRNFLASHLTLFHALPPENRTQYIDDLTSIAQSIPRFQLHIGPPFQMRRGVGIHISSEGNQIKKIHEQLQLIWKEVKMTEQDLRKLGRVHVTIQNKVVEEKAKETFEEIKHGWKNRKGEAVGLGLYEYQKDGSWVHLKDFDFQI